MGWFTLFPETEDFGLCRIPSTYSVRPRSKLTSYGLLFSSPP